MRPCSQLLQHRNFFVSVALVSHLIHHHHSSTGPFLFWSNRISRWVTESHSLSLGFQFQWPEMDGSMRIWTETLRRRDVWVASSMKVASRVTDTTWLAELSWRCWGTEATLFLTPTLICLFKISDLSTLKHPILIVFAFLLLSDPIHLRRYRNCMPYFLTRTQSFVSRHSFS